MTQLFPILVVAVVLAADRTMLAPATPPGGAGVAVAAAVGPVLLILAIAAGVTMRAGRRLAAGGTRGTLAVLDRVLHASRVGLLAVHVAAVFAAGWLATIRGVIGDLVIVDETIAIAPPILGAAALWWIYYPIERRLREALLIRRLDEGRPVYGIPTRGQYVLQQVRLHLLLLLVPVLLILLLFESIHHLLTLPPFASWPMWAADVASTTAGLTVFIVAPFIARLVLAVEPLGEGPIRDDLEGICRRHRIRVRSFLLWRTDGSMINAAVMGIAGPLRYVLLTDGLVEMLTRAQIRAVMAHEIGHVRRHHMAWLVAALLATLVLASLLVSLPLVALDQLGRTWTDTAVRWIDVSATALTAILALLAFGWISRRFERQADTFAVQHLSGLGLEAGDDEDGASLAAGDDGPRITAESIITMHAALESVARLNSVSPGRRSWRHGSIAWRQEYLMSIVGRPVHHLPIDRLVRRLQVAVVGVLILGTAATATLAWIEGPAPPLPDAAAAADLRAGTT